MRSKSTVIEAPTAAEIVRGPASMRRQSKPRCITLMKGKEKGGQLNPYIGPGQFTVPDYTAHVATLLRRIFVGRRQVVAEWSAMLREEVRSPLRRWPVAYSPEVDLAVGPFAVLRSYEEEYDRLAEVHEQLLRAMLRAFQWNLRTFGASFRSPRLDSLCSLNLNARCFMAIEIEKGNTDVKYLMGSMSNAAALGRVGIVVAWEWPRMGALLRARETWGMWGEAGKNTVNTGNLIVLNRGQMVRILTRFAQVLVATPPYRARPPRPSSRRR